MRSGLGSRWRISSKISFVVAAGEREPAGQSPVEDDAQGPDVGASVEAVGFSPDLLGRHVGEGPRDLAPPQPLELLVDGQAEVADVRLAPQVEQDVRGFQVAVDNTGQAGVGVVHGFGDEGHDPDQAGDRQRYRRGRALPGFALRHTRARCSRRPQPRLRRSGHTRYSLTIRGWLSA